MKMNKYSQDALELINGAYDLHIHTNPSHFKRKYDDIEILDEAEKYKMKGILIKSHYDGTYGRAELVNNNLNSSVKLYGGLALNAPVGGINPYAAESALKAGAKVIWMPTRDSVNSLKFGNMPGDFFDRAGIQILDNKKELLPEVIELFRVIKKYDGYLATGHLDAEESVILCNAAQKYKVKTILTHPDWNRTLVPFDIQKELASKGTIIEKTWSNVEEGTITSEKMAEHIKEIGYKNVIMVTDRGQWNEKSPMETLLDFIEEMLENGIEKEDLRTMLTENPEKILLEKEEERNE